jgi:hypothetical protein
MQEKQNKRKRKRKRDHLQSEIESFSDIPEPPVPFLDLHVKYDFFSGFRCAAVRCLCFATAKRCSCFFLFFFSFSLKQG